MSLIPRHNGALNANPPTATKHLSVHGSDWLWAVTAIYLLSLLVIVAAAYKAPYRERIFHYLITTSLLVGTITYYACASDLGSIPVTPADNIGSRETRQIFYARYINWFVGWTPLVIAVGLISGVSWATIVYNVGLTWIWVASWLAGALCTSNYKWGFFAWGLLSYFLLATSLLHTGSTTAKRLGIARHHTAIAGWLVFIWLIYSIAYGVDDGGNKIGVTGGWIFFGILDLCSMIVTSYIILFLSRSWDYGAMNLYFTQYGRVAHGSDLPEREKTPAPVNAPATTQPVVTNNPEQAV